MTFVDSREKIMKRPVILFKFGTFDIDEKKIQNDPLFNVVPEVGFQLTENRRIPFNSILQFMIIRLLQEDPRPPIVSFEVMCQTVFRQLRSTDELFINPDNIVTLIELNQDIFLLTNFKGTKVVVLTQWSLGNAVTKPRLFVEIHRVLKNAKCTSIPQVSLRFKPTPLNCHLSAIRQNDHKTM